MKAIHRYAILILIVTFLGSCAAHHPYARAKPKAGKKKSCNCPDFGFNSGNHASGLYFYVNGGHLDISTN